MKESTRAALLMISAALCLSLVPVMVKALPPEIPVGEKLLFRGAVGAVVAWAAARRRGIPLFPGSPSLLLARAMLGGTAMLFYFVAIEGLTLAQAVTVNRLSPFFVAIFAAAFLGERLRVVQVAAIALAFLGVAIILRPGEVPAGRYALLALGSAVLAGGAHTALRALRRHDRPEAVVFWFSAIITLMAVPLTIVGGGKLPDRPETLFLLGNGVFGVTGQLLMTAAYRYAPGGEVAMYGYLSVVYSVVWQLAFWGVLPSVSTVLGATLVLTAGWINWKCKHEPQGRSYHF
ncbi:EamA family transporter [Candidatus Fermentibacteria bacterium]|nr:EamA family transporter [Candidatus Fermentibacteria bacterium]